MNSNLPWGTEVLMEDHADQPELAPERVGAELLVLKTIIDCLDQ